MTGQNAPLLIVTGLAAEARLLRGPETLCVSAPPAALAAKLDAAFAGRPPRAVVSFGLAGGLKPGLRAGAIVIAGRVVAEDAIWPCDPDLRRRLLEKLPDIAFDADGGSIATCDEPVVTRHAKAELYRRTGAVAVDTESHIAAGFAASRGLPFAVLRAITDTAEADLPPLALRAIDAEGRLDFTSIATELARRPGQLLQLPGTAISTAKAMRALGGVRRRLGPHLGL